MVEDSELIFIPYNTPSLKNSKVKTARGIFASKTVKQYLTLLGIQSYSPSKKEVKGYVKRENLIENLRSEFEKRLSEKDPPYKFGFHFVRRTKHDFDFNNANQIIADLLVAHNIIEDDNMKYFLPYPLELNGLAYSIDKENPGVYIKIN